MSASLSVLLLLGGAIGIGLCVAWVLEQLFPAAPREYNLSELPPGRACPSCEEQFDGRHCECCGFAYSDPAREARWPI